MGEQNFGFLVMREKLPFARFHALQYDGNGNAVLPSELGRAVHDHSDRKFVALALEDKGQSTVVNACDTDWYDWEETLRKHGVVVEQVIGVWCREEWTRKRRRKR